MASENEALNLIFQKSKKQIPKTIIFSYTERIKSFIIKFLQVVAISDKKLKTFIVIFSILILLFSKTFSTALFHSTVAFQQ